MSSLPNLHSRNVFQYRHRKKLRIYWFVVLVAFLLVGVWEFRWFVKGPPYASDFYIFIAVAIFCLAYFYNLFFNAMFIITDRDGIEYNGPFYRVAFSWSSLQRASVPALVTKLFPARFLDVRLTSREPSIKKNFWTFYHLYDLWGGKNRYFISLSPKLWDRYDELLKIIKERRPDLDIG